MPLTLTLPPQQQSCSMCSLGPENCLPAAAATVSSHASSSNRVIMHLHIPLGQASCNHCSHCCRQPSTLLRRARGSAHSAFHSQNPSTPPGALRPDLPGLAMHMYPATSQYPSTSLGALELPKHILGG